MLSPLVARSRYRFEFEVGFVSRVYSPPISVAFFGTTDCVNLPFGGGDDRFGCPTNGPDWIRLGVTQVNGGAGNRWIKAIGLTKKQAEAKQMNGMMAAIIRSFVLSFSLFHIIYVTAAFYDDKSFFANAVGVGLWVGIAVIGLTMVMHDIFEQRSRVATRIHVGFEIVTVLTVSGVIGLVAG